MLGLFWVGRWFVGILIHIHRPLERGRIDGALLRKRRESPIYLTSEFANAPPIPRQISTLARPHQRQGATFDRGYGHRMRDTAGTEITPCLYRPIARSSRNSVTD